VFNLQGILYKIGRQDVRREQSAPPQQKSWLRLCSLEKFRVYFFTLADENVPFEVSSSHKMARYVY